MRTTSLMLSPRCIEDLVAKISPESWPSPDVPRNSLPMMGDGGEHFAAPGVASANVSTTVVSGDETLIARSTRSSTDRAAPVWLIGFAADDGHRVHRAERNGSSPRLFGPHQHEARRRMRTVDRVDRLARAPMRSGQVRQRERTGGGRFQRSMHSSRSGPDPSSASPSQRRSGVEPSRAERPAATTEPNAAALAVGLLSAIDDDRAGTPTSGGLSGDVVSDVPGGESSEGCDVCWSGPGNRMTRTRLAKAAQPSTSVGQPTSTSFDGDFEMSTVR